jgi:hypothetical protein
METEKELHRRLVEQTADELKEMGISPLDEELEDSTLTERELAQLVSGLHRCDFDTARETLVETIVKGQKLSVRQLKSILQTFSFDGGRIRVVEILKHDIEDPKNLVDLIGVFSFDSGISDAIKIVSNKDKSVSIGDILFPAFAVTAVGAFLIGLMLIVFINLL